MSGEEEGRWKEPRATAEEGAEAKPGLGRARLRAPPQRLETGSATTQRPAPRGRPPPPSRGTAWTGLAGRSLWEKRKKTGAFSGRSPGHSPCPRLAVTLPRGGTEPSPAPSAHVSASPLCVGKGSGRGSRLRRRGRWCGGCACVAARRRHYLRPRSPLLERGGGCARRARGWRAPAARGHAGTAPPAVHLLRWRRRGGMWGATRPPAVRRAGLPRAAGRRPADSTCQAEETLPPVGGWFAPAPAPAPPGAVRTSQYTLTHPEPEARCAPPVPIAGSGAMVPVPVPPTPAPLAAGPAAAAALTPTGPLAGAPGPRCPQDRQSCPRRSEFCVRTPRGRALGDAGECPGDTDFASSLGRKIFSPAYC